MADELHSFLTGSFWLKLKEDIRKFRVFNREDLACAVYFHIRRMLTQPGWSCRANPPLAHENQPPLPSPDLALFANGKLSAVFQLEFHLTPGMTGGFLTAAMNERMASLRRAIEDAEQPQLSNSGRVGRGYLVAVYDAEEEWFYPDQAVWDRQSCFWLPVNCRTFPDCSEWRQKWDRLARFPNR